MTDTDTLEKEVIMAELTWRPDPGAEQRWEAHARKVRTAISAGLIAPALGEAYLDRTLLSMEGVAELYDVSVHRVEIARIGGRDKERRRRWPHPKAIPPQAGVWVGSGPPRPGYERGMMIRAAVQASDRMRWAQRAESLEILHNNGGGRRHGRAAGVHKPAPLGRAPRK